MPSRHRPPEGRTNWRRFALAIVPLAAITTAAVVMTGGGAIAASFAISGQQAKISADSLDGTGFTQYGWIDQTAGNDAIPVATSGITHAEMRNMCQSVVFPMPIIGDISLKIKAGGTTPVVADDLFIDMNQLDGDATFSNIEIGRDASTLDKGPNGAQGFQGMFAQQADKVHIDHLHQVMYATHAGTFKLSGLHLTVGKGKDECF
jgi:hypothetical protein